MNGKRRLANLVGRVLSVRTPILVLAAVSCVVILCIVMAACPGPISWTILDWANVKPEHDGSVSLNKGNRLTSVATLNLQMTFREEGLWAPTRYQSVAKMTVVPLPGYQLDSATETQIFQSGVLYFAEEGRCLAVQNGGTAFGTFGDFDVNERLHLLNGGGAHSGPIPIGYLWNALALLAWVVTLLSGTLCLLRSFEAAFRRQSKGWARGGQCTHCGYDVGGVDGICPECGNLPFRP